MKKLRNPTRTEPRVKPVVRRTRSHWHGGVFIESHGGRDIEGPPADCALDAAAVVRGILEQEAQVLEPGMTIKIELTLTLAQVDETREAQ